MTTMTPRVLLIEDNDDDIELAQREFEKAGLKEDVRVIRDGAEALDHLMGVGTSTVQLVLLDLNLPRMNGLQILQRMRLNASTRQIPVVILTVSRKEPDLLQSFTIGISDYLIKPLDSERFKQIYKKYVRVPSS
jgi:two-component system response regulator